jgi:hypothetical protein
VGARETLRGGARTAGAGVPACHVTPAPASAGGTLAGGDRGAPQSVFKNPLRSRPYVISKEAPHRTIGSHEILRAD